MINIEKLGREAANEALFRDGVKQIPIKITNPRGPGVGFFLLDIFLENLFNYYYIFITLYLAYLISKRFF